VAVARALALQPRFVLADEPTSALDVSLRGELLDLLAHVRDELAVGIVLVSHDIQATRYLADDVLVMYRGDIVERGAVHDVVDRPAHAYSQRLLASVSTLSGHRPGGHA
jgi:ABC-type glutathione transport system ATPase component